MDLLNYRYDKYSFTGNDGIIKKILEIANIKNGFFVEFGAIDGVRGSNCRKLFEEGWSGLFIESDEKRFVQLENNYKDHRNIITAHSTVVAEGINTFDTICATHMINNIDFCSIDIDGLDLEIFESIKEYLPTIVCIEGGQMLSPFHGRVERDIAANNIQQSLAVINEAFNKKGYKLLCSYQYSFFIKEEFFYLFDVSTNLFDHYFNGLLVHYKRMPFIQMKLKEVGVKNQIINEILKNSNFKKYGYHNRKRWAKKEKENIIELIKKSKNDI